MRLGPRLTASRTSPVSGLGGPFFLDCRVAGDAAALEPVRGHVDCDLDNFGDDRHFEDRRGCVLDNEDLEYQHQYQPLPNRRKISGGQAHTLPSFVTVSVTVSVLYIV